ncbi:hypothetical protein [Desulfatibacillum aliphaticivorans]|uniref:hypothetical protein n=1 Tax=Desulfatibacillum aliphaticivorans TaxID=218208 RepID=UPI000412953D|nr:hypothetical protein [Desulfatibacillum aliphaticivorans]
MFQVEKTKTIILEEDNNTSSPKQSDKPRPETTKLDVVNFFLNLYRKQIGAPPSCMGKYTVLDSDAHGPESLYELKVRIGEDVHTRRMTITPLGEDTGSRSKCFFVIYDVHMVLKIPPMEQNNLQEYIESIRRDAKIVDRLAPRECIVPKVSVILKMIRTFDDTEDLSPMQLEEVYIKWLMEDPRTQEFLKINGSFVYFMDLAKYYFLGGIVAKMQGDKDKNAQEILGHHDLIWEIDDFEGRYGYQFASLCEDLQHLYGKCRTAASAVLIRHKLANAVQDYRIRNWFLIHLAARTVKAEDADGNAKILDDLNKALQELMEEEASTVNAYRKMIKEYIREKMFFRNKPQMETIIINLLELLAWLRTSKVSIRDLKPDNLLVAGNPDNYPYFLTNAGEYNIGLIDVETAADFSGGEPGSMEQPLLGGTPNYATPSHLFANEIIALAWGDVGRMLHYQDWQATLGMIYRVATGKTLFPKTGKILPKLPKMFSQAPKGKTPLDLIKETSKLFWQSAMAEFDAKRQQKEEALRTLKVTLDETAVVMLQEELAIESEVVLGALKTRILNQKIYTSKDAKKKLFAASAKSLNQQKVRLANTPDGNAAQTRVKRQALKLFGDLERMKNHLARLAWAQKQLAKPTPTFSVFEIMGILFDALIVTMHKPDWPDLTGGDVGAFGLTGKDATYEHASI